MSVEEEDTGWEWQSLCKDFLFEYHVPSLERVFEEQYGGDLRKFVRDYLEPVLGLLESVRSSAEKFFAADDKPDDAWVPYYEKFVQTIIHITRLETELHKGDFYIHLSTVSPGQLLIKYYDSGKVASMPMQNADFGDVWSRDWTHKLRAEVKGRFHFLHCIVASKRGLERRPWRYLMNETRNASYKQLQAIESVEENCKINRQSLFLEKPLNVFDLNFELLHSNVVYLPGSHDVRGGPVLFIDVSKPDWCNLEDEYNSVELARLFMYLQGIPKKKRQELGFSFVVDTRKAGSKRRAVELIIEAMIFFQESCPGAIHMAYILARKESPLLMFSATKIKDQLNFEFKLITTVENLKNYVDGSQLTPEFGGTFHYDHDEWIRFRIKLEPFMTGCRSAAKLAMGVMHEFTNSKFGESVQECRKLIEEHQRKIREVFEDSRLSALQVEGEQILIRLQEEPFPELEKTEDYSETVQCVTKLYHQMNEVFCKLEMLTDNRTHKLDQCLQLREFEDEMSKTLTWMQNDGDAFLDKHTEIGDSIGHVQSLQHEFKEFEATAKCYCDRVENLLEEGSSLYQSGHYEGVGIKERCKALEDSYKSFSRKLDKRRKQLNLCDEFHRLIVEANEWSLNTLKQMALMNMEDIITLQGVLSLKDKLSKFTADAPPWPESRLNRISEIATNLGNAKLVEQAEQILLRYKEVRDMLNKREETLLRAEERLQGPVSSGASTATGGSDESTSSSPGQGETYGDGDESDLDGEIEDNIVTHVDPTRKISAGSCSRLLYSWKEVEEPVPEEENLSPKVKEKLKYIVEEMIETERDYVKSLEYIMANYLAEMEKPDLLPSLKGKKNILFGNIERIYDFHKKFFLKELESTEETPLQIGGAFLKYERQFYLYALYNKNKPKSDQLLTDHGNAYFRKRQKELGDKLDLGSYLIKPVQRMGKYDLLLKDMIRVCNSDGPRVAELRTAQEMVKFQLRHGNDLLAMDSIRDCDVNIKEQGRLLRQDNFTVWNGKKKHQRRVFLFEDLVLFTKPKKQQGCVDLFFHKNSLKTADIGLTENVGDGGLKFELWFRKRKTGEHYKLQAKSIEIKTAWVTDITRILWKQAMRNREYGLTEASTGISVGSQPALLIPTTMATTRATSTSDETSPYHPVVNSVHVPLLRTYTSPSRTASPAKDRKRLSLVSSETASSVESSSSSGVCDMSAHGTDEEGSLRGGHHVGPKGHHNKDRRSHHRTHSRDHFGPQKGHHKEPLRQTKSVDSSADPTSNKRMSSSVDFDPSKGRTKTPEEERKMNFFSRNFFLPAERNRSRSTENSMTVPFRRGTNKDKTNNEPRRRSLIERITHRSNSEEKDDDRRRSLVETRTLFADAKKSLDSNISFEEQSEKKRGQVKGNTPTNSAIASDVSTDGSTEV